MMEEGAALMQEEQPPKKLTLEEIAIEEEGCLCCCCVCHCSVKETKDLACCGCFPIKCGVVTIGILTILLFAAFSLRYSTASLMNNSPGGTYSLPLFSLCHSSLESASSSPTMLKTLIHPDPSFSFHANS